jgi:cold shock CspA family protein
MIRYACRARAASAKLSLDAVAGRKALLGRYSGMIDSMKPKFFFIRSGVYPNSIFAHNSTVDPDVMSDLSMGRDINFRIRFNRAGPVALNIKIGRLG